MIDLRDYGMFTKHGFHPLNLTVPDAIYQRMVECGRPAEPAARELLSRDDGRLGAADDHTLDGRRRAKAADIHHELTRCRLFDIPRVD